MERDKTVRIRSFANIWMSCVHQVGSRSLGYPRPFLWCFLLSSFASSVSNFTHLYIPHNSHISGWRECIKVRKWLNYHHVMELQLRLVWFSNAVFCPPACWFDAIFEYQSVVRLFRRQPFSYILFSYILFSYYIFSYYIVSYNRFSQPVVRLFRRSFGRSWSIATLPWSSVKACTQWKCPFQTMSGKSTFGRYCMLVLWNWSILLD